MGDFKGVSESFHVNLVPDDGGPSERVICQIGLDGLFFKSSDGSRTLRKYPLNHISRWAARGTSLVLYTKTPVDVEDRNVTIQSDEHTVRSVLDTLTCCCMQMCELLNSNEKPSDIKNISSNPYTALLNNSKQKAPALLTADEVEFWKDPEQTGWLMSQGEHIKTWRRRWFVLKQGFLFRFASNEVTASSKPRGIVDLSKVTDVKDAREDTGRPNSLKLCTATGKVYYIADSETALVEWMSALEGAVSKIIKKVAGVEDEPPARPASSKDSDWARQLEKKFSSVSTSSDRNNAVVKIVNYEGPTAPPARDTTSSAVQDFNYGGLTYSSIAGIAGIAGGSSSSAEPLVNIDYGSYPVPSYPTPSPQMPSYPAADPGSYSAHNHMGFMPSSNGPDYMQQLTQLGDSASPHNSYSSGTGGMPGSASEVWQVHYTPDGRAYYFNSSTGVTQWEAPAGMA